MIAVSLWFQSINVSSSNHFLTPKEIGHSHIESITLVQGLKFSDTKSPSAVTWNVEDH